MKRRHSERNGKNGNSSTGHTNIQTRAIRKRELLHSALMALDHPNMVDRLVLNSIIILVDSDLDRGQDRGLDKAQKVDSVILERSTLQCHLALGV